MLLCGIKIASYLGHKNVFEYPLEHAPPNKLVFSFEIVGVFVIRVVFHPVNLVDFELVEHRDPSEGFVTIEINELANLFVQHFSILVASFKEKVRQNMD